MTIKFYTMRKQNILAVLFSVLWLGVFSQDKIFDLKEVFTSSKMYPQSLTQLQWIPNTHNYVYVNKDNDLVMATAPSKETKVFVSLEDINKALEAK